MNTAGFSVKPLLKVISFRWVAVISTLLQVLGLSLCALTVTEHFCWTLLGLGVLVGSGVGITFINNIVICHKTFPNSLTLVFGEISAEDTLQYKHDFIIAAIALSTICLIGSAVPKLLKVLRDETIETELFVNTNNTNLNNTNRHKIHNFPKIKDNLPTIPHNSPSPDFPFFLRLFSIS